MTPGSFMDRLAAVEVRLRALAVSDPTGLTEPDPGDEERWEAGQVWAHLAEFVPYWTAEIDRVLEGPGAEPVPFGRTKADAARKAAIASGVGATPAEALDEVIRGVTRLRSVVSRLDEDALTRLGGHPTLGPMEAREMVERFAVGHLEEHADQLDLLAQASAAEMATEA